MTDARDPAARSAPGPEGGDSVSALAEDLRTLRHDAGNPTLSRIEREAHVSKSIVSEALAGRRLPSERTVRSVVGLLGGDVPSWVARRNALAAAPTVAPADGVAQDPAVLIEPVTGATAVRPGRRVVGLGTALVAVIAALVVGVGGTLAVEAGAGSSAQAGVRVAPTVVPPKVVVKNGTDPADTACLDDAVVATSETGARGTQLQIIYSADCHAAWSRITRYDDLATGNEVSTSIYRQIAPKASDRQSTTEPDAQSAYTTLLVRPTPQTQICAVGSITVAGKTVPFGEPVCL